ncbi:uncharacterized protein N7498_001023 [Penicillium cinerascens]|uniref:Uncharacterized protein n=1 Tax=Penicillium cinerascens TaxID=70096 RepID=A0A9W9NFD8_9EURO|nr:uncharacterized protein N7498_001023 [Penicillium cinerascens]KAJ5218924.1 hypothetical protein N7498_001023 [Penicillium cinerascens]
MSSFILWLHFRALAGWARASFVRMALLIKPCSFSYIDNISFKLWRIWYTTNGPFHRAVDNQHKHHGDVVRISPNELSFASVESWKAIYQPKKAPLVKSEFYDIYGSGFNSLCVGSERNPQVHNRMRKSLAAALSTKALLEQEDMAWTDSLKESGFRQKLLLLDST